MPTESAFFFAGLLFIAAALGYVFAKFGDTDAEDDRAPPVNSDYLKGLNFLLDEDADSALEVFARLAESDDDALETHFALGSLFRKRGETARAIRIHQNIMARPDLDQTQKGRAQFALAEDYLGAGLLDRAESLYSKLREVPEFKVRALRRLMRIFEQTQEWADAAVAHDELARVGGDTADVGHVAHYFCELATGAMAAHDLPKAREMLKRAEAARRKSVRSSLVHGDIARETGEWREAMRFYQRVAEEAPELLTEVVPRMAAVFGSRDDLEGFDEWLRNLQADHETAIAAIAMAVVARQDIDAPAGYLALERFVAGDKILRQLVDVEALSNATEDERRNALDRIRGALRQVIGQSAAYRCTQCGYSSLTMQWQCPGCRAWETVRPELRLNLGASA